MHCGGITGDASDTGADGWVGEMVGGQRGEEIMKRVSIVSSIATVNVGQDEVEITNVGFFLGVP